MDNGAQTAKVKMSGYLYLKIKKRMMSSWKNYWFVLEDRLLLYYRSKDEYEAISPCKGSINLGPPCAVKSLPSVQNGFQIETRTVTYTLKAENSDEQKKWMQIILSALNQNQNFNPDGAKRLSHFRYSLDDLIPEVEPNDSKVLHKTPFERQNTMPNPLKSPKDNNEIIQRLQKIGAHSYGGSLEAISKIATKKVASPTVVENTKGSKESVPEDSIREELEDDRELLRHKRVCGENIYERISGDSQYSNRGSFLVDNENYSVPLRKSVSVVERDVEKSPLVQSRETKSLVVENDQYGITRCVQSEEAVYSEPKVAGHTDCNKNSVIVENSFYTSTNVVNRESTDSENLYEDLDKFNPYSRPVVKVVDETSSQSSVECSKVNNDKKKEQNGDRSLKKSKSFIKRMWRKKKSKKEEKQEEEEIYEEIDPSAVEKTSVSDGNAIQMLSELHSILEKQKTKMKTPTTRPNNDQVENDSKPPTTVTDSGTKCPTLPPKTHKVPHHTVSKHSVERSLDEILEDLDKEKMESKSKVQMLIEKFSEPEGDVVLRKQDKPDFKLCRHSDELNKLLNELTKVTSAPIMTPGVTSSLVNPNLTDEEWLKLLPIRQRRLSEPDYDVPRLHTSIQLPKTESDADALPATRFFGPVLPSSLTENKQSKQEPVPSPPVSMTPDSLEVEEQQKYPTHYSYTSHDYNNYIDNQTDLKRFSQDYNQDDKIIYAMPKSYVSVATHIVNTCQNICGAPMTDECTIIYKTVKNVEVQEEIFKDSLELCNETSTEF
ncbi:uncharacterized protein LOC135123530 isoform X2 [Zophobas morio]